MSVDHIVGYEKLSGKKYKPLVQDWVYEQSFPYPHHERHSTLIGQYKEAKQQHDQSLEILQSAFQRKWGDSQNARLLQSIEQCQERLEETQKALEQAEEALRQFNDHAPRQRIELYESEIREWEIQLAQAQEAQEEYTKQLLNDPDAARKRLELMVNGYSGEKAEYSPEQLGQLRSLKNEVESIELKILNCQRDIERIHQLAAEQEHKAQVQAIMDASVARFAEACVKFSEAWKELQSLADEYSIRVVSPHNLQIPTGAKFKQSNSPHEGTSSIYVTVEK